MKETARKKVLMILSSGVALSLTRSPRQYFRIVRATAKAWKEIDRHELYRAVRDFHHNRLVEFSEQKDGTIRVILSESGKRRIVQFDYENITIPTPRHWSGFWHGVFYDIPNRQRAKRDTFRSKLKELGFVEWQKSVFVYPYACRDQIDFIVEVLEIRPYVRYAEFRAPTNEAELKLKFGL